MGKACFLKALGLLPSSSYFFLRLENTVLFDHKMFQSFYQVVPFKCMGIGGKIVSNCEVIMTFQFESIQISLIWIGYI